MMCSFSRFKLPDGTELAYEVLGSKHGTSATPFIFVVGMTGCRNDTKQLTSKIALNRPGIPIDLLRKQLLVADAGLILNDSSYL
jgi:hypothetical protein